MFLLLLIAPKQKNFCVTKDRVPLRGSAVRLAPALLLSKPPGLRYPAFASGVAAPSQKTDRCPCSASAVSSTGRASAAQPAALLMCPPCRCATSPLRGEQAESDFFYCDHTAKGAVLFALPPLTRYPRACTWLSLGESWREAPERGARPAPKQTPSFHTAESMVK